MIAITKLTMVGPPACKHELLDWLLSEPISDGTGVPFHSEARAFRQAFDELVVTYDAAMTESGEQAVKGKAP